MIASSDQAILAGNTVHIWTISLDETALDLPELLSDDEMSRFSRINHHRARTDFLRTRTSLRLILAKYLGCPETDIVFSYNKNGKPELAEDNPASLQFNLSHSGNYCLLAVTAESDVGVDIERFQTGRDYAALAERFFSATEHRLLGSSLDETLFYRMWVLKEASVKARGMKLLAGLDRFECIAPEDGSLNIVDKLEQNDTGNWSVRQWQPDDRSIAAVVVRCAEASFVEKTLINTNGRLQ